MCRKRIITKKGILITSLLLVIFVMSLGYAALSQYIEIEGIALIDRTWDIKVTNVTSSVEGNGQNVSSPYVGSTVTMNAKLPTSTSKVTYTITLKNEGNVRAKLHSIEKIEDKNNSITYTISGVEEEVTLLEPGKTNVVTVVMNYETGVTSSSNIDKSLMLSFNYVEDTDNNGGGSGSTALVVFNKESQNELTFTSQADLSTFQEVKVDNVTVDSSNYTLTSGSTIVTLKKEYLNTLSAGTHTIDIISTGGTHALAFKVTTTKPSTSLVENILKNNEVYADNVPSKYVVGEQGIDFAEISSDTNGKGLYYTSTNTEQINRTNGTTYYFRGDVQNNYVKFGKGRVDGSCTYNGEDVYDYDTDEMASEERCLATPVCYMWMAGSYYVGASEEECLIHWYNEWTGEMATLIQGELKDILWRIVRINEDGSIRIVTQDSFGDSDFNTNDGDNTYVGYMYGSVGQTGDNAYNLTHSNDNPSTIKTFLDDWYTANLSSYASKISNEAGFCNDRSVAPSANSWALNDTALGYAKNYTVYGAAGRLANIDDWTAKENAQPQFACPNESNDLFTMNTSTKGNKKLTNPIGLLTADEVAYAGGVSDESNLSMYLTNGYGYGYWTMSPHYFSGGYAGVWTLYANGKTVHYYVGDMLGIRPVVNIKSTVELSTELPSGCTEQNGTENCPYIIKTN